MNPSNGSMKKPPKRGSLIPDEDDVVRHVPYRKIIFDENQNIVGIFPEAYALRKDEQHLSVSWLDIHEGTKPEKLKHVLSGLKASKGIGNKSALTIGNVSTIKGIAHNSSTIKLRFTYAPNGADKAHSLIHNINNDDLSLLSALATEGFASIKQVGDV